MFALLYVRANSKEIWEGICVTTPVFFVDSNSSCKDLFFPRGPNLALKPLYLVGIVLKTVMELTFDSFRVLISTSSSSMFPSEWNKSLSILSSMAFNWFLSEFIRTMSWFLWSSRSGLSRRTTSLQRQKKNTFVFLCLFRQYNNIFPILLQKTSFWKQNNLTTNAL